MGLIRVVNEGFLHIFHRMIDEVVAEKSKRMLGPHKEANLKNCKLYLTNLVSTVISWVFH